LRVFYGFKQFMRIKGKTRQTSRNTIHQFYLIYKSSIQIYVVDKEKSSCKVI
jgi:hypothetical protein